MQHLHQRTQCNPADKGNLCNADNQEIPNDSVFIKRKQHNLASYA